jgi:hypothetical protein
MKTSTLALLALLMMCVAASSADKSSRSSEQVVFSAEESEVKKPVALRQDVLAILRKDEMVRNVLENEDLPPEKMPPSWFSASEIHLGRSRDADIVVVANQPLAGGNVTTFWVFCSTAHGYKLVLNAPAHTLRVKNTRRRGYRDIELVSATAVEVSTVLCRFDGEKYAGYKTSSELIR